MAAATLDRKAISLMREPARSRRAVCSSSSSPRRQPFVTTSECAPFVAVCLVVPPNHSQLEDEIAGLFP